MGLPLYRETLVSRRAIIRWIAVVYPVWSSISHLELLVEEFYSGIPRRETDKEVCVSQHHLNKAVSDTQCTLDSLFFRTQIPSLSSRSLEWAIQLRSDYIVRSMNHDKSSRLVISVDLFVCFHATSYPYTHHFC